jgi:O-antigen ligase
VLKINTSALGNLFLFCLFGSVFAQPRPSFFAMVIGTMLAITILIYCRSQYLLHATLPKQSYLIWSALLAWPIMHMVIALSHQPIAWAPLGNPMRAFIALGVFVYLACFRTTPSALYLGIGAACATAFFHAMYDKLIRHLPRALGWFNNEIHMGDYSSLAGVFALIIALLGSQICAKARIGLFILGCLAYIAAAASGTRTAVLTVICLLPLIWIKSADLIYHRLRLVLCIAAATIILLTVFSDRARGSMRIQEGISDVKSMMAGGSQTSIGDRKQMWIAALDMAQSSPLIGIGLSNFRQELLQRIEGEKILPLNEMQNQAHSQVLHSLATGGIVLLACYLFFVLSPLVWFMRAYKHANATEETRLLAYLGLTHIVSHVLFGLTAAIFDIQVFSSLYLLGLATFAALCLSQQTPLVPTKH